MRTAVSTGTCTAGWGHADNSHQRSKQSRGAVRLLPLLSLQWVGFISAPPASARPTRGALHHPQTWCVSCSALTTVQLGSVLLL